MVRMQVFYENTYVRRNSGTSYVFTDMYAANGVSKPHWFCMMHV